MTLLAQRAVASAVNLATSLGLAVEEPHILRERSNILIWLKPYPVVARVATLTGKFRPDGAAAWMECETAVMQYLTDSNAPSVRVSPLIPNGPYQDDGLAVCFMERLVEDTTKRPDMFETGKLLRELHSHLQGYNGKVLPTLISIREIGDWLDLLELNVPHAELVFLKGVYQRVVAKTLNTGLPIQALHGDAHIGNTLYCERGQVWIDFEETCRGPVQWDLACLLTNDMVLNSANDNVAQALAGYGFDRDDPYLDAFIEARALQTVLVCYLLADEFPELRGRTKPYLAWLSSHIR